MAHRHQPYFLFRSAKLCNPAENQPGKELFVTYPAGAFFSLSSLSTCRFIPLAIADSSSGTKS